MYKDMPVKDAVKHLAEQLKNEEWRNELDPEVEKSIERLLKRIDPYSEAWEDARNPAVAQLWVVVAELNEKIDALDKKIDKALETREEKHVQDEELRESMENY